MQQEIWKDVPENNNYKISNLGNIKSLKDNFNRNRTLILKLEKTKNGYLRVQIDRKHFLVHRLVAQAFIPNIFHKNEVNHIDGNKNNNNINNLEWVTASENQIHAWKNGLQKPNYYWKGVFGKAHCRAKNVLQYDLNGNFIKEWDSFIEAATQTNTQKTGISACCRNIIKHANGFKWKFKQ